MTTSEFKRFCNRCQLHSSGDIKYCRKCGAEIKGVGSFFRSILDLSKNVATSAFLNVFLLMASASLFAVLLCLGVMLSLSPVINFELHIFEHVYNLPSQILSSQPSHLDAVEILYILFNVLFGGALVILIPSSILSKLVAAVGILAPELTVTKVGGGLSAIGSILIDILLVICMLLTILFMALFSLYFFLVVAIILYTTVMVISISHKKASVIALIHGFFCLFVAVVLAIFINQLHLPIFLPALLIIIIIINGVAFIVLYCLSLLKFFGIRLFENYLTRCPICANELTLGANVCSYCGVVIFVECQKCNEKFITKLNYCPKCGKENHKNNRFCTLCGNKSEGTGEICNKCNEPNKDCKQTVRSNKN